MGAFVLMVPLARGHSLKVVVSGGDGGRKATLYFTVFFWVGTVPRHQHSHPNIILCTTPLMENLVTLRHPKVFIHLVLSPSVLGSLSSASVSWRADVQDAAPGAHSDLGRVFPTSAVVPPSAGLGAL